MTLDGTYNGLKSSVADWMARADLTAFIPDYIVLFEAYVNRNIFARQGDITVNLTPSAGVATLPSDYLEWKNVTWNGSSGKHSLLYANKGWLDNTFPVNPQGVPQYFTIVGSQLILYPTDNSQLIFTYKQGVTPFASGSNWLSAAHIDYYLFGTLVEANAFIKNAEAGALWKSRRDEIEDEINLLAIKSKAPAATKVDGPTP